MFGVLNFGLLKRIHVNKRIQSGDTQCSASRGKQLVQLRQKIVKQAPPKVISSHNMFHLLSVKLSPHNEVFRYPGKTTNSLHQAKESSLAYNHL